MASYVHVETSEYEASRPTTPWFSPTAAGRTVLQILSGDAKVPSSRRAACPNKQKIPNLLRWSVFVAFLFPLQMGRLVALFHCVWKVLYSNGSVRCIMKARDSHILLTKMKPATCVFTPKLETWRDLVLFSILISFFSFGSKLESPQRCSKNSQDSGPFALRWAVSLLPLWPSSYWSLGAQTSTRLLELKFLRPRGFLIELSWSNEISIFNFCQVSFCFWSNEIVDNEYASCQHGWRYKFPWWLEFHLCMYSI